ncbi:Uncharacterised protein [Mycobacterium tuberculosis]|nr:Uncharacterised protein [Mycobacterium tuberculosis]
MPPLPVRRAAISIAAAALIAPLGAPSAIAAAPAGIDLESVVTSLTENGGLYIDPGVKDLSDTQLDKLRTPLESANLPVYIAVFPAGTIPDRATAFNQLIVDIHDQVKRKGTYAVVVGGKLRAYSWSVPPSTTAKAWASAKRNGGGSLINELSLFARNAGGAKPGRPGPGPNVGTESPIATPTPEAPAAAADAPGSTSVPIDEEGGTPVGLIAGGAAAVLVAAGGAVFLLRRKRRPAAAAAGGSTAVGGEPGTTPGLGAAAQAPSAPGPAAPPPGSATPPPGSATPPPGASSPSSGGTPPAGGMGPGGPPPHNGPATGNDRPPTAP